MKYIILLLLALLSTLSCNTAKKSPSDSETKWGHLPYARNAILLNVLPNGKIHVCGKNKEFVKYTIEAIETWSTHSRRKYYLNIVESCEKEKETDALIKIHYKDELATSSCTTKKAAYAKSQLGEIIICDKDMLPGSIRDTIVHEIGHVWGMCDQYNKSENGFVTPEAHGKNCEPSNRSRASNEPAVMSVGSWDKFMYSPTMTKMFKWKLYQDDIKGIKHLTMRNDIRANILWKYFLKSVDEGETPSKEPTQTGNSNRARNPSVTKQSITEKDKKIAIKYLVERFNAYLKTNKYNCKLKTGDVVSQLDENFAFNMTIKSYSPRGKHQVSWELYNLDNDLEEHIRIFSIALDNEFKEYCPKK